MAQSEKTLVVADFKQTVLKELGTWRLANPNEDKFMFFLHIQNKYAGAWAIRGGFLGTDPWQTIRGWVP